MELKWIPTRVDLDSRREVSASIQLNRFTTFSFDLNREGLRDSQPLVAASLSSRALDSETRAIKFIAQHFFEGESLKLENSLVSAFCLFFFRRFARAFGTY